METMSYSNRELVEFFIGYKLSQRNYSTSLLRPEDAGGRTEGDKANSAGSNGLLVNSRNGGGQPGMSLPPRGDIEAVKAALRDSANEFELLFTQAFSNLSSQLDITPDTAYHSFKSVMDEVFKDGINWGRVVGLFAFGGVLCVECVEKDMTELVSRIADWMTMYLDEHISPWIQSQGGWVSWHGMSSTCSFVHGVGSVLGMGRYPKLRNLNYLE
ncbi:bcl-2-like protein 1 isoform X2 [Perca fluviatilis]|uniref:bcl-2-like protein 1 isoform X2 n=1 Tax=Perca fluviatilis TaxID=8168 RepID=UPI00196655DD|nr:bcl-2-like protein 1 isoform X2 [Perca fluviatilis]